VTERETDRKEAQTERETGTDRDRERDRHRQKGSAVNERETTPVLTERQRETCNRLN